MQVEWIKKFDIANAVEAAFVKPIDKVEAPKSTPISDTTKTSTGYLAKA